MRRALAGKGTRQSGNLDWPTENGLGTFEVARLNESLQPTAAAELASPGCVSLSAAAAAERLMAYLNRLGEQTMHARFTLPLVLGMIVAPSLWLHAQSDLQRSLQDTNVGKHWVYNDLKEANAQAQATGKPLLVVFRCVP
jgi:hypothetical protein